MAYSEYHNQIFRDDLDKAMKSVRQVLDTDRSSKLRLAENVDHTYLDKYRLAEMLTNTSIVALMKVLEELGLTKEALAGLQDERTESSSETTMRFSASESCTFTREKIEDIPAPVSKKTQETSTTVDDFGANESTTTKSIIENIVSRVKKKYYLIQTDWEISIYSGTDLEHRRVLKHRTASYEFVQSIPHTSLKMEKAPFPPKNEKPPVEVSLTWLFQQIDTSESKSHFSIDLEDAALTRTPRRNAQIEDAVFFLTALQHWTGNVGVWLSTNFQKYKIGLSESFKLSTNNIFVPVLPLFADESNNASPEGSVISSPSESWSDTFEAVESGSKNLVKLGSPPGDNNHDDATSRFAKSAVLSVADTTSFLKEHARTLKEVRNRLHKDLPNPDKNNEPVSFAEVMAFLLCQHTKELVRRFLQSMRYIEIMMEEQLVAAIGKRVTSSDLDKFVRYHNEQFFEPSPTRFCYTIRRPERYPDGILSIEEGDTAISTHVRIFPALDPVEVPLNAATTLALTGKVHLHGWLNHQFGTTPRSFRLSARARQFSSFVLLVGTMTSCNRLQPKDAIILRNKDEVRIPLLLNQIPTATEFKTAIASLSPDQQRFAKSFRSMQLDSSILGVCVIQIKPQLEKLLGLPQNSLTKEMKLAEDLTELFVEYQIPSDLVSCDCDDSVDCVKEKVANVREHVKSVMDVIATQKQEQLKEQVKKTDMSMEQKLYNSNSDSKSSCYDECGWEEEDEECAGASPKPGIYCAIADKSRFGGSSGDRSSGEWQSRLTTQQRATGTLHNAARLNSVAALDKDGKERIRCGTQLSNDGISRDSPHNGLIDAKSPSLKKDAVDFVEMPKLLDGAIELHDKNAALRLTTIETATSGWIRIRQENLLSKSETGALETDQIVSEKSRTFDLLDALSRSGSLEIPFSDIHVLICATHQFEKTVIETVIQENINPIEKLEISTLLMASTILGVPSRDLVRSESDRKRLEKSFPMLVGVPGSFQTPTITSGIEEKLPL